MILSINSLHVYIKQAFEKEKKFKETKMYIYLVRLFCASDKDSQK